MLLICKKYLKYKQSLETGQQQKKKKLALTQYFKLKTSLMEMTNILHT